MIYSWVNVGQMYRKKRVTETRTSIALLQRIDALQLGKRTENKSSDDWIWVPSAWEGLQRSVVAPGSFSQPVLEELRRDQNWILYQAVNMLILWL